MADVGELANDASAEVLGEAVDRVLDHLLGLAEHAGRVRQIDRGLGEQYAQLARSLARNVVRVGVVADGR